MPCLLREAGTVVIYDLAVISKIGCWSIGRHSKNISDQIADFVFFVINPFQTSSVLPDRFAHAFAQSARHGITQQVRARRRIVACVGLSLLIHAVLFLAPHAVQDPIASSPAVRGPLTVHLMRAPPPPVQAAVPQRDPVPKPRPVPRRPAVIALSKPAPRSAPAIEPRPAPAEEPDSAPAMDMMTMLNAARERRRAAEESAARENAAAAANGREPSANEIAMANIKRDLQRQLGKRDGASGVFEILHKGTRTAQFAFHGWIPNSRNNWRETFDVDAGLGGDVDLAIVRRMIALIRKHYSGDFNWDSHRLGRIIVLSDRMSDNAALEAFLMREFFGG